jgi:hypothetical protein
MTVVAGDFIIDSRDVQDEIDALEVLENKSDDDIARLNVLLELKESVSEYDSDWGYGATLVCEDYWIDYVRELCDDAGYIGKYFPSWIAIDWETTAQHVAQDYTTVDFDGSTYYVRCA